MQGDKITSETLSFSVKIFLQVKYIQVTTSFKNVLILKLKQINIQDKQNYMPQYASTHNYSVQAMYTLSDQTIY